MQLFRCQHSSFYSSKNIVFWASLARWTCKICCPRTSLKTSCRNFGRWSLSLSYDLWFLKNPMTTAWAWLRPPLAAPKVRCRLWRTSRLMQTNRMQNGIVKDCSQGWVIVFPFQFKAWIILMGPRTSYDWQLTMLNHKTGYSTGWIPTQRY